jgi:hypothetical protein
MAYEESIKGLQALVEVFTTNGWGTSALNNAIKELRFAQEQARLLVLAQDDKRRSLAQEIAQTLRVRGYWVPDDIMSSDLISAVGQAVSMLKALGEKIADNELPSDTKPKDIVDGILHILDLMASDSREINRRNEVVWTEGMLEFIRRALNCTSHIIEGYEGNPDVQALVQLGVFEVIGNDMYHLRNAGYRA